MSTNPSESVVAVLASKTYPDGTVLGTISGAPGDVAKGCCSTRAAAGPLEQAVSDGRRHMLIDAMDA